MNPISWGSDSDDRGTRYSASIVHSTTYVGHEEDDYPNGQPDPDDDVSDSSSNDDQPTYYMVKMAQTIHVAQTSASEVDTQGQDNGTGAVNDDDDYPNGQPDPEDDDDDDYPNGQPDPEDDYDDDYPNGQPDPEDDVSDGDTVATELIADHGMIIEATPETYDTDDDGDTVATELIADHGLIIEATPGAYDTDDDGDTVATELIADHGLIIEATPGAYDTDDDGGELVPPCPFPRQRGEPVTIPVPFVHRDVAVARFGEPPTYDHVDGIPNILLDMLYCSQFFAQGDRNAEYIAAPLVKVFMRLMLSEVCASSVDHEVVYRLRHDVARICEQQNERAVIMDESDPMKWLDLITFTDIPVDHNKYDVLRQWVNENVHRGMPLLDVYLKMLQWRTGVVTQRAN